MKTSITTIIMSVMFCSWPLCTPPPAPPLTRRRPVPHCGPVVPRSAPVVPHGGPVVPHCCPVVPGSGPVVPHCVPVVPQWTRCPTLCTRGPTLWSCGFVVSEESSTTCCHRSAFTLHLRMNQRHKFQIRRNLREENVFQRLIWQFRHPHQNFKF